MRLWHQGVTMKPFNIMAVLFFQLYITGKSYLEQIASTSSSEDFATFKIETFL